MIADKSTRPVLALVQSILIALVAADETAFKGRIFNVPSSLPEPKAFFPLTDGSGATIATWPSSQYNGTCLSPTDKEDWWVADDTFGSVVYCSRNTSDYLALSSVAYAGSGNFTVAFWVKPTTSELAGDLFQYLFSHSAYGINNPQDSFAPNSINVYLPEQQHPAYGLIRTVVKDENDPDNTSFIDSDGTYDNNQARLSSVAKPVTDGAWHFVTVSSRLDGEKGFLVYIDGSLAAQLPPPGYQDGDFNVDVDGGDPIRLGGEIVLCSRDNVTSERHYSGSLAHLSLFDTTLNTQQISELYQAVPLSSAGSSETDAATTELGTSMWLNQFSNNSFLQVDDGNVIMCLANETDTTCASDYSCTPLSPAQVNSLGSNYTNVPVGVCARPNGIKLPTDSLPIPSAYFPLSNYTASSWPLPEQWFWNSTASGTAWAQDFTFGAVVDCKASIQNSLSLDSFTWGASGAFAFNFWFQQRENAGSYFQYLLSVRAKDSGPIVNASLDVYQPNEVHIYLPEAQHPAYNLVRVILKDGNDNYSGPADENFLDSDGEIGSNMPRNSPRLNFTDGLWHMLTLTTLPSGDRGFSVYVDGLLMADLEAPQTFFSISGGDPVSAAGNLVLCGRADLGSERFFDGKLTQLAVFNNALTSQAVTTLYNQIYQSPPEPSVEASSAYRSAVIAAAPQTSQPASPLFGIPADAAGARRAPGIQEGTLAASTTSSSRPDSGSGLSGGAIAGIVLGTLAGAAILTAAAFFLATSARRRRMHGVARLQEVPMPQLAAGAPEGGYTEDQFVVTLNKKVLEADQQRSAAI